MNMYPFDQPGDADEHNELFLTHKSELKVVAIAYKLSHPASLYVVVQYDNRLH